MNDAKLCAGCRNNFYNGNNPYDVKRCWSVAGAKVITRYRLGISVPMNIREAYQKVKLPDCYHETGYVFLKEIPSYAQTKKQRDDEAKRQNSEENSFNTLPKCDPAKVGGTVDAETTAPVVSVDDERSQAPSRDEGNSTVASIHQSL